MAWSVLACHLGPICHLERLPKHEAKDPAVDCVVDVGSMDQVLGWVPPEGRNEIEIQVTYHDIPNSNGWTVVIFPLE